MNKKVNYLVEKSNLLNTMGSFDMSLTELRLFLIYLSKLNARDKNTRAVSLNISEFESLFDIKFNTARFTQQIRKIMSRTVEIYDDDEKIILTLYSKIRWKKYNAKVLEIVCNDEMLPYLFELKKNYTTYMIENIAKLNSVQKIRLYEIFKQYEKIHNITLKLLDIQKMMCCKTNTQFPFFRRDTLDPAIKDINEFTDITITYKKVLSCRKVVALKFNIESKQFNQVLSIVEDDASRARKIEMLYVKCNQEYSLVELQSLYMLVESMNMQVSIDSYILAIYLRIKSNNKIIKNMYSYTLSVITNDIKDFNLKMLGYSKDESSKEVNYDDISDFIEILENDDIPLD